MCRPLQNAAIPCFFFLFLEELASLVCISGRVHQDSSNKKKIGSNNGFLSQLIQTTKKNRKHPISSTWATGVGFVVGCASKPSAPGPRSVNALAGLSWSGPRGPWSRSCWGPVRFRPVLSCPAMSTMARRRARGLRRERAPRRDTTCRRPLAMSTASAPVGVGRRWPARTDKLRRWPTGAGCRDLLCSAHALLRVCMPAWCGVGWNGLLACQPRAMFRNYSLYLRCRGLSGHA
jgi:hypothetical protein